MTKGVQRVTCANENAKGGRYHHWRLGLNEKGSLIGFISNSIVVEPWIFGVPTGVVPATVGFSCLENACLNSAHFGRNRGLLSLYLQIVQPSRISHVSSNIYFITFHLNAQCFRTV